MRVIFKIVFLLLAVKSFSQNNYTPKGIPPSPEAASLGKYVETPVSYATGIPQIGVPIYTISEGNINVPISLSYHAGGTRVEETASSVGLGWSLFASGVITRTVKGKPDDQGGYISINHKVKDFIYGVFSEGSAASDLSNYDYEPDDFIFNFGNYSGRFSYNQDTNSFFQMPLSNIKITPIFNNTIITSFVVTTSDGFEYYFGKSKDGLRGAIDVSEQGESFTVGVNSYLSQGENSAYNSSWYLLDIISPDGKHINFSYQLQISQNDYSRTEQEVFFAVNNLSELCSSEGSRFVNTHFSFVGYSVNVLKTITSSNEKIDFEYDTQSREDLIGGKRLKKIKIFKNNSTNPLKEFELFHSYFTTVSLNNDPFTFIGSNVSTRYKRLRLDSMQEKSLEDNQVNTNPKFIFEYNSTPLPYKFSNAQDYWGFYNGKEDNPNLIPYTLLKKIIQYNDENSIPLNTIQGNADRSVDIEKCKAGVLTKITYPTGGSTVYEYENNTASTFFYNGDFRSYNMRNRLEDKIIEMTNSNNFAITNSIGEVVKYETTFSVGATIVGKANTLTQISGCDNSDPISMTCDYIIIIKGNDASNSTFQRTLYSDHDLTLLPGNYKIIATPNLGDLDTSPNFFVTIKWGEDPTPNQLNTGGLRVKKITSYDREIPKLEKKYYYNKPQIEDAELGETLMSSGNLASFPMFLDRDYSIMCNNSTPLKATKLSSNTMSPLANVKGSILSYEKVTEIINNDIKTEYFFDTNNTTNLPNNSFSKYVSCEPFLNPWLISGVRPVLINTSDFDLFFDFLYSDDLRGNLIKENKYKFSNGVFDLIEKKENIYEVFQHTFYNDYGIKSVSMPICAFSVKAKSYPQTTFYHRPKKTTVTKYFNTGDVTQITENFYENNPLLPSKVVTSNSNGDSIETKYFYPQDLPNAPNASTLIAKNMIGSPLVTQIFNGTEKLSEQETQYGTFPSAIAGQSLLLPQFIYAGKGTTTEKKITFNSYDTKGNITQYTQENGVPVSIIWGYNNTQPVGKLENITYNSIPAALITAIQSATDSATSTEAQVITTLNALRSSTDANMVNAMISTYTYKPLVGVSIITDPKGNTQTFSYDSFGRLQNVKDKDGNTLSENEYHYRP